MLIKIPIETSKVENIAVTAGESDQGIVEVEFAT
jgi:hypothetical protein